MDDGDWFSALETTSAMDSYGNILARLVCFILRHINQERETQTPIEWMTETLREQMEQLGNALASPESSETDLDKAFHVALKGLFLWHEPKRLMTPLECPVHRFLIYASVNDSATGFIHTGDITGFVI